LVANAVAFISIGYFAIRIDAHTYTGPIIQWGLFCASVLAVLSCWVSAQRKWRLISAVGLTIVGNIAIYVAFWTPVYLYKDFHDVFDRWEPSPVLFPVVLTAGAVVAAVVWNAIAARRR
jgi:hypothetical protein